MNAPRRYFDELSTSVGTAWNRFWFTPSDGRVLGVMRVLAGAMAFYAIATYAPDLDRWFGVGGMLPLDMIQGLYENQPSLLEVVPPRHMKAALAISLVVIGLFTLGVGGRVTAIAATAATLSFFSRAPLVTSEFEYILAFLLAYLCVGRAGDEFSVPALLRSRGRGRPGSPGKDSTRPVSAANTIAARLIQIHVAIVHLMMACGQLAAPESPWWNGEGIYLAAMRPGMALVDFSFLADHPRIVAAWSHAITLYLLTFPVLVWIRLARPLVLAAGVLLWVSLALASGWLMFCLAMLVGLLAFLTPRKTP
ncbi:MAG TPA: hypothetical protein VEQ85_04085 [Lacipirellulaceae bacterium]|nr:hypothetical protein [Lacipirellulaceae bacterium]